MSKDGDTVEAVTHGMHSDPYMTCYSLQADE